MLAEINKVYIGQDRLVRGVLTALLAEGHVLIESVPGLGKTLLVRALGQGNQAVRAVLGVGVRLYLGVVLDRVQGMPVFMAEDPLTCVASGSGQALDHLDALSGARRPRAPALTGDWRTA